MITADQIVAHLVGDYILQSDYMASEKTKKNAAAIAHVLTYFLPFICITRNWKALLFIAGTHFIIDRWRLARYVCWAKNFLAPRWIQMFEFGVVPSVDGVAVGKSVYIRNPPWSNCSTTGYGPDKPVWLSVWLLIIADNTVHLLCNGLALRWWP